MYVCVFMSPSQHCRSEIKQKYFKVPNKMSNVHGIGDSEIFHQYTKKIFISEIEKMFDMADNNIH